MSEVKLTELEAELLEVADLVAGVEFLADETLFDDNDLVMICVGTVRKARAAIAKAKGEA